jgi:hypothetical protein
MPGATLPPGETGTVSGTIARVERIERTTVSAQTPGLIHMPFSYPGALTAGIESPPWYVPRSGQIVSVRVSLTASASGTNTISLRVSGVEQQQFTISSGKTLVTGTTISVAIGDYVTLATIAVADSNLSVDLALR